MEFIERYCVNDMLISIAGFRVPSSYSMCDRVKMALGILRIVRRSGIGFQMQIPDADFSKTVVHSILNDGMNCLVPIGRILACWQQPSRSSRLQSATPLKVKSSHVNLL
jgi:hypothetical protein